jgi:formate dehydrogenase subunit delta
MEIERLRYMAEQIAREFATQGEDKAIAATAEHIRMFWDPRMKEALLADAKGKGRSALSPIVVAALQQV